MAVKMNIPDLDVIGKVLTGEKALFELLMRRYNSALYKVGRSYGFKHQDVEDLMQDAHLTAYINLAQFENRSQYKTWLIKIMINKCLYRLGRSGFKNELLPGEPIHENAIPMFSTSRNDDTEKQVLNRELSSLLEKSLEEIAIDYRTVFVLREKEGLSVAETAEALDISEANVKVRLNRAKEMLKQKMENFYSEAQLYEFNLIYCDAIVEKVLKQIESQPKP